MNAMNPPWLRQFKVRVEILNHPCARVPAPQRHPRPVLGSRRTLFGPSQDPSVLVDLLLLPGVLLHAVGDRA